MSLYFLPSPKSRKMFGLENSLINFVNGFSNQYLNWNSSAIWSQIPLELIEDESLSGIPQSLRHLLSSHILLNQEKNNKSMYDDKTHKTIISRTPRSLTTGRTFSSGCNDAFSVFGFLAFLLALLGSSLRIESPKFLKGSGQE